MLTSSNKSETAVHCCDPATSVLVMLASRNVFHVVSALQSLSLFHNLMDDLIISDYGVRQANVTGLSSVLLCKQQTNCKFTQTNLLSKGKKRMKATKKE